jgi:hypothetical protein
MDFIEPQLYYYMFRLVEPSSGIIIECLFRRSRFVIGNHFDINKSDQNGFEMQTFFDLGDSELYN